MKSLIVFLQEALKGSIKPTKEWMKEYYEKYNKELFNNELPSSIRLSIYNSGPETALGWQGFDKQFAIWKDKLKNGMYQMFIAKPNMGMKYLARTGHIAWEDDRYQEVKNCEELEPYIVINAKYDFSDFQKEDTLIHEMIHLWVSKDGLEPKRCHGKEFKNKCNEVRELAKKLYNIEYDLDVKANQHGNDSSKGYQISDEWQSEIRKDIEDAAKKGGGVYGILLYLDKSKITVLKLKPYTKRFVFCTRNMIMRVLKHAKTNEAVTKILIASPRAYMKYCETYGKFRTVNSFARFWDMNDYDEQVFIDNTVKEERLNESLNEGLIDWLKKVKDKIMSTFLKIKAGTPMSAINLEDYFDDVENLEDEEQEGCVATDKKMIEDK